MEIFRFFINIWACDKNIVREKKIIYKDSDNWKN